MSMRSVQSLMRARAGAALSNNVSTTPTIQESDDHVYVDISIPYDEEKDQQGLGMPATYNATLTQSIIDNPSLYHLIVDRFQLSGGEIPAMIFDPNTPGSVTLEYDGASVTTDIIYVYPGIPAPPAPPLKPYDEYTIEELQYYFIYEPQFWVDMVNTALATSHAALAILKPAMAGSQVPFFMFNAESGLMEFYAETAWYEKSLANPILVYTDNLVYRMLPFFTWWYINANKWLINVQDYKTNTVTLSAVNYLKMIQQTPAPFIFNPARSIVFTSNSLPVKNTYTQINNKDPNNSNASSLSILVDFRLDMLSAMDQAKELLYVAQQTFRRLDLYGNSPLRTVDLAIFWTDRLGNLFPLRITVGKDASIKLLFIKIGSDDA